MIRQSILLLIVSIMVGCLSACATTQNYEAALNQWIGKSEKDLITGWGLPDKQYQLDKNTRLVSYVSRSAEVYPGGISTCAGTVGDPFFGGCAAYPPVLENYSCETIFTLVNGRITRWGHKGNNCRL